MRKTARQTNIELLRIIAIAGVIFLHYYNADIGGASKYVVRGSVNYYVLMALENTFICSVDLFVMISGYFLSRSNKRSVGRVLSLLLQTSILRGLIYCLTIWIDGKSFSGQIFLRVLIPTCWFVILYSALYLVSPLLNHAFVATKKKQAVLLLFFLFSVWPTLVDLANAFYKYDITSLSSVGMYGSQNGYTIINFFLCYLMGAYVRELDLSKLKKANLLFLLLVDIALISIWCSWVVTTARSYHNPLVVFAALLFFLLFLKMDLGIKPAINWIAESTLSVYIGHTWFLPYFRIEDYVNRSLFVLVLHIVVTVVCIFGLCAALDKIYHLLLKPVNERLKQCFCYEI